MHLQHGAVLHHKLMLPISCLSPALMPRHRSQLRARNCTISYQETHMCEAEEGMSAAHSCPPRRHAFIVSTQFCYPGAVGYFLQSHLLPPAQSYSLTHQAAWFCRAMPELVLPTPKHFCFTLGKKKKGKNYQQQKTLPFPPTQKIPDLFKATCKCGCVSPGFSILMSQSKKITRNAQE